MNNAGLIERFATKKRYLVYHSDNTHFRGAKQKKRHFTISQTRLSFTRSKIAKISTTSEKTSGRGALSLLMHYLQKIGLYELFFKTVLPILPHSNNKGLQLGQFIKQIIAFMIDGTESSISAFDVRKTDVGYASVIENTIEEMASSHQIKLFFCKDVFC
jgi:hypothetical protein